MAKRKRTIDKTIDKMGDDLAIELLHHAQMNETQDYVERGRALASQTDDEVKSVWVEMFERWFDEKTAEKALAKLEEKAKIHGALVSGFKSVYGFSSDEQGIRHPLLDKEAPAVNKTDAMFMIGACSAFISYLINKSRCAGLLT